MRLSCKEEIEGSSPFSSPMANYKRKKKKERKEGWSSESRLHSRTRLASFFDEQITPNPQKHRRKKSKNIEILAKSKPGAPRWWNKFGTKGWFVWAKYEKIKDAENALVHLQKNWQNKHYEFKIDR